MRQITSVLGSLPPRSLGQFRRVATEKHRPKRTILFFPFSRDITRDRGRGEESAEGIKELGEDHVDSKRDGCKRESLTRLDTDYEKELSRMD